MNTRTSYQILTTSLFTLVIGCGNVTTITPDGGEPMSTGGQAGETVKLPGTGGQAGQGSQGGQGGEASSPGTGGTTVSTGGTTVSTGGTGGSSGTGGTTTTDGGTDAVSITGLTGSYFASARGAAYITRIDTTVDFDPGPANFEPEEVTWTGEIETDNTIAIEIQANDTDTVSLTIGGQTTPVGATGLTGLSTNGGLATFGGWQQITIDIKRDMTLPFKAILERQIVSGTPLTLVPTEVLLPL